MPSDNERRRTIVDCAVPTPRSPNGLFVDLRIGLYDSDGHSILDLIDPLANGEVDAEHVSCLHCSTDHRLISEFARLIEALRARIERERKRQAA
jgi:hypothetical protein